MKIFSEIKIGDFFEHNKMIYQKVQSFKLDGELVNAFEVNSNPSIYRFFSSGERVYLPNDTTQ